MSNTLGGQTQGIPNDPGTTLQILHDQQVSLVDQLGSAQQQLRESQVNAELTGGADKASARTLIIQNEVRVAALKDRLGTIRDRMASAQDALRSAPVEVAFAQEQDKMFGVKPKEFTGALMVLFVLPIVIAVSRWIWRRSPGRSRDNVLEGSPQIARLEQAVEAIAIEVERISEAQRFSAKLLAERAVEPGSGRAANSTRGQRRAVTPLP